MSNDEFSSVEWLYNKMVIKLCNKLQTIEYTHIFLEEFEQAKAMHKEEIENAYREGWMENIRCKHTPNRYYNETYGDGKQ